MDALTGIRWVLLARAHWLLAPVYAPCDCAGGTLSWRSGIGLLGRSRNLSLAADEPRGETRSLLHLDYEEHQPTSFGDPGGTSSRSPPVSRTRASPPATSGPSLRHNGNGFRC